MAQVGGFLAGLASEIEGSEADAETVAKKLRDGLEAGRQELGIKDLWSYGPNVEMELAGEQYWAVECVGPDAFHFYPGVVRDGKVVWLNVWVAPDLTLDEMIGRMSEAVASARGKRSEA